MDDDLVALLEGLGGLGLDTASLQESLAQYLPQAADETTQQMGFRRALPAWAQGLAPEVTSDPEFDPYMRVFWGGTKDYQVGQKQAPDIEFGSNMGATSQTVVDATVTEDRTSTVQAAMNRPYTWDNAKVSEVMKRMQDAGLQVQSFDDVMGVWQGLVERAAMTYSTTKGQRALTPWDVLDLYKDEAEAAGITLPDPNRREVTVNRSVSDITEGQAWSSIQGTLQQMLGRDPTDQELRDFTYRMNRMAAENPTITRTIQQYKNGEIASTTSRTKQGFTAADMAQEAYDEAQSDPEFAEYQSAGFYFNALEQALGAIGG